MLSIEKPRSDVARLPLLAKAGLGGMAIAGLADVVAHLESNGHAGHLHVHTSSQVAAHTGVLVSMVLIFLGVVSDGVRRSRARQARGEPNTKESRDAVR
jgi:hypothetical protein